MARGETHSGDIGGRMAHAGAALHLLILDFDGVILESNGIKTVAFREVFGRYPAHLDAMMRYHSEHVSLPRRAKFEYLVTRLLGRPGDTPLVDDLTADFGRRVRDRVRSCAEVPGARELLEEFSRALPLYLVSVTPEPELLAILEARDLRRYFTAVYGCPPWTKPTAIEAILASAGADRDSVVLVGDSPGDLRAAQETSIGFLGRNSGIRFPPPAPHLCEDMFAVAVALRRRPLQ